jgi:hypothetical protein
MEMGGGEPTRDPKPGAVPSKTEKPRINIWGIKRRFRIPRILHLPRIIDMLFNQVSIALFTVFNIIKGA